MYMMSALIVYVHMRDNHNINRHKTSGDGLV